MYQKIWNKIKEAETITIFGHVNPDGDCCGSQLGLKHAILENFPQKKVFTLGSGLPRLGEVLERMDVVDDETIKKSLALIVDVGNQARIEDQRFKLAPSSIKIDHHVFQEHFGDIELIDEDKVACAEIIAHMLIEVGAKITKAAATPLLLGILTDSCRLSTNSTNAETFKTCASLLEHGASLEEIYSALNATDEKILLFKGYIFSNYRKTAENVVYLKIEYKTSQKYGIDYNTAASLVNSVANIKGSPIWVFFAENEQGEVRVEFRSNKVPVQPTATRFGGGGHLQAAGCRLKSLDQADEVLKDLDQVMIEYRGK